MTLPARPTADAAMDAERVYVAIQTPAILAVERQSGEVVWSRPIGSTWPLVLGDHTLFIIDGQELHALDPTSGESRWRITLPTTLLTAPIFHDGQFIAILNQGDIVSLNPRDGTEQWRLRIPNDAPLFPPASGGDGRIYISLDGGSVAAVSTTDGRLAWRRSLGGGRLGAPTWAPDRVFVGSTDNYFYALDEETGDIEWRWRSGGDVVGAGGDHDAVYFASLDNMLRALNRGNGNQRWRKEITTRPALPPQVIRDIVLTIGVAPSLTAFSARDGAAVGTYVAPSELQGPPLVDSKLQPFRVALVVLTRDGRLIGLTPTAALFLESPLAPLQQLPGTRLAPEPPPA